MKSLLKAFEIKAGFWSLFDQSAVSLGNFLTQMLLARSLSWSSYGVFALLYGILFFLNTSAGALITYPLSLKGASADSRELSRLSGTSLLFNAFLFVPEGLIVLCAVAVLHHTDLFFWTFVALAFWQLQETLRRALMARLDHRGAVWGDGLSYLGQAVAILTLASRGALTLRSAFVAIAATSAAAALLQAFQMKTRIHGFTEGRSLAREFWRLGTWAFSTNVTNGATQQAFPWALGLLFGTADAGSFQAVVNPLKVFNPLIVGTQNLIVPAAAKEQREHGAGAAARRGIKHAVGGALLFLPYLVALLVWPHAVLTLLYGSRSPYTHLELVLRVCVLAYAFGYWGEIVTSLLNGLGQPRPGFLAQLGATVTAVAMGLPLIIEEGLIGAIVGLGICAFVKAAIALRAVWLETKRERKEALVRDIAS